ncbi:MAG: DEAD/DEAH box helicase, partial [Anaerolineae bacterium]|nr:DEAD/DEAH box helicase [Anaerolineae bacterium]
MSTYVEVALLSNAFEKLLTYSVPAEFEADVRPGVVVGVPLRNTPIAGVVIRLRNISRLPMGPNGRAITIKAITAVLDAQPALNARQIELARWIAAEYHTSLGRACAIMIPPGLTPSSSNMYEAAPAVASSPHPANAKPNPHDQIVALLRARGPMIEAKLRVTLRKMGVADWQAMLEAMLKKGLIVRNATLAPPKVKAVRSTLVQLMISAMTLDIVLSNLDRDDKPAARRRAAALRYVQQRNGIAWADWLSAETSATRDDLAWLQAQDYVTLGDAERWRDPLSDVDFIVKTPPPLTPDQAQAWRAVETAIENVKLKMENGKLKSENGDPNFSFSILNSQFLLRGVTGSGKTEVYLRAVAATLAQKRGVIILVPEISLTPQTARRFLERFPGKVALIHSRLKPGERYDTWRRIRAGELPVVVGARSALFAPVPDVGLIVLDEEHESSYKQDRSPAYDARRAAAHYAQLSKAVLIYGSATPSLEAWHAVNVGR